MEDEDGDVTFEDALSMGDLVLKLRGGQQLLVIKHLLVLSSPVIRDALSCHPGSEDHSHGTYHAASSTPAGMPSLSVEGDYDGWTQLLRFMYNAALTGRTADLGPCAAFKILPIAHTYNMRGLMRSCVEVVQRQPVPSWVPPPSPSLQQQQQQQQEPSLFQWLALGDSRQYAPLVRACLEQLSQEEAAPAVRAALSSQHLRGLLEELSSGTLMELLNVVTGLPSTFKGVWVPDLTVAEPKLCLTISKESLDGDAIQFRGGQGCMLDSLLLLPRTDTWKVEVLNLMDGAAFQLQGHADIINTIDAAGGGPGQQPALVLSCSADCTVRLWDLATRHCRLVFVQHVGDPVWSTCFCSPSVAASGSRHGVIKVWDLGSGACLLPDLVGHDAGVNNIKASTDGRLLLSASEDQSLMLWDLRGGKCVRTMSGHVGEVSTAAMDAAGRMALSGSDDMTLKAWDLGSGRCTATMLGHEEMVHSVRMDAAGTRALSLSNDNTVCVWDLSRSCLLGSHSWPDTELWHMQASADMGRAVIVSQRSGEDPFLVRMWSESEPAAQRQQLIR